MNTDLKYWSIRSTLTMAEAALLILGKSPYEWPGTRLMSEQPSGFQPIFDQMINDAKDIEYEAVESDEIEGEYFTQYTLMTSNTEGINTRTKEQWLSTEVSRLAVIKWAKNNKLNVVFLEGEISNVTDTSDTSPKLEYTTELIQVLHLAIKHFFYPRLGRDAKKDEVIEWIQNKGKELEINVSKNVADAMFTIIKPNDHNPKITRD